jgi:hypothetical protein
MLLTIKFGGQIIRMKGEVCGANLGRMTIFFRDKQGARWEIPQALVRGMD